MIRFFLGGAIVKSFEILFYCKIFIFIHQHSLPISPLYFCILALTRHVGVCAGARVCVCMYMATSTMDICGTPIFLPSGSL